MATFDRQLRLVGADFPFAIGLLKHGRSDAIESTIELMEKLDYQQHGDDILVEQTRNFLRTILGLYDQLPKIPTSVLIWKFLPDTHSAVYST